MFILIIWILAFVFIVSTSGLSLLFALIATIVIIYIKVLTRVGVAKFENAEKKYYEHIYKYEYLAKKYTEFRHIHGHKSLPTSKQDIVFLLLKFADQLGRNSKDNFDISDPKNAQYLFNVSIFITAYFEDGYEDKVEEILTLSAHVGPVKTLELLELETGKQRVLIQDIET